MRSSTRSTASLVGDEVHLATEQALPVVDAQQAADAGGVDEGDAAQVDHEAVDAAVEQAEQDVAHRRRGGDVELAGDADDGVRADDVRVEKTDHLCPHLGLRRGAEDASCFSAAPRVARQVAVRKTPIRRNPQQP